MSPAPPAWPSPWPARPDTSPPPVGGGELTRHLVGATQQPLRLVGDTVHTTVDIDARATAELEGEARRGAYHARAFLDLDDLEADRNPGAVYGVYLNLPDDPSETDLAAHHIGNVSLFGIERARNPRGDEHAHGLHVSMEITGLLDRMAADGSWRDGDHLDVAFRPLTLEAPPGQPELAAQLADTGHPDLPITVGRVSVHLA